MAQIQTFRNRLRTPRMQRLINWAAVFSWAGIIFYLSSLSRISLGVKTDLAPVFAHAIEYAVLTVLLIRALSGEKSTARRAAGIAVLIALALAGSDEYHQSFVKNRDPSVFDLLVDTAAIATVAFVFLSRKQA